MCRLNFAVGEAFAEAAKAAIATAGLEPGDVDAIASHGQTIYHAPGARPIAGLPSRSTLQVGDIALIAARTGIRTVGDFRTKDIALGGQGAPLVPFVDYLLTGRQATVWLNIGGIANTTAVPRDARPEDVTAFDTGPGNTLLDRTVRERTTGRMSCDRGGKLALAGTVDEILLGEMLEYRYFRRKPPKSTGPEEFGEAFLKRFPLPRRLEDACATLAALTADTIMCGVLQACGRDAPSRIIASGGGVRNDAIMSGLRERLSGVPIVDSNAIGVDPDAKEAFAFAVLGLCTLEGVPNTLPSATGASRAAVLGKVASAD